MFEDPSLPSHSEDLLRSPADRLVRKWQFAKVLNLAALIYAFLHKFFVPFVLYFLNGKTEFRVIDWWWFYHASLALTLNRRIWNDALLRAVLGFGFGGLLVQSYDGLMAEGWHSFSLWLTTITSGAVLIYVTSLTSVWPRRAFLQGFCGVFTGILLMGMLTFWLGMDRYALSVKPPKQGLKQVIPKLDRAQTCGVRIFSLPAKSGSIILPGDQLTDNRLYVKDCGLSVALQQIDPAQPLKVFNASSTFLNIRLNHLIGRRWQPLTNRPLRPGDTLQINIPESPTDNLWILESDVRPQAGLTVLFSDTDHLREQINAAGLSGSIVFSREGLVSED